MGFSSSRLSFEVIGEGVAIDPVTGLLSVPADGLGTGITLIVTATDAAGSTVGRYRLTLAAPATEAVAPALATAPSLAGSSGTPAGTAAIGAPVTLDPGAWHGTPAPSLAVAWLLDGAAAAEATGLSYVPQPADDGRALSARVTATNAAGSAAAETATCAIVHAAPTVVAPLADVAADAGAAPVAVEAASAFAGAALTFAVSGTGATIDSATGVVTIATDQLLDGERITVTATNSGGSAQASFLAAVCATPPVCGRPPALAGAPEGKGVVGTAVTLDPGTWGGVPAPALAIAWLLDGAVVEGAAGASYTPSATDEGKRLSARVTATNAAGEAIRESDPLTIVAADTAPVISNALVSGDGFIGSLHTVSYTVTGNPVPTVALQWQLDGSDIVGETGTTYTAIAGGVLSCEIEATNTAGSDTDEPTKSISTIPVSVINKWYPYMGRTAAEYALGIIGGQGRQRFKYIARTAADPEVVWWGMDVNGGFMYSGDAGAFYTAPQLRGMTMQECSAGLWIDPSDANRVLFGVSGADARSTTTTPNAFDLLAGIYQSTDGGHTASLVLQLDAVPDCGSPGERDNRQLFVHALGGTAATRTVYYAHKPRLKGGAWQTGRIYKSTNGGTSWAAVGESLTNATFGNKVYWIDRDASGNLYLGCTNGLFKSTDNAVTWAACTGISGPVVIVNAYHGGTDIWAAQQGNGAYKATNAAGTTYSRNTALGAYDIEAMAVCPSNSQRILVASNVAGSNGKWSHNGGTSWTDIVNRSSTGATSDWADRMYGEGAVFSWTPGSTSEVIVQRGQNFGRSVDGGASTDWRGNGTDYQTRKWLGVDPLDWQIMICGTQDTICCSTTDGQNTENGSGHTSAQRTTILNGGAAAHGHGGLILKNGSFRTAITAAGGSRTARLPLRHIASGTNLTNTMALIGTTRSGCEFSGRKPDDDSIGWMGKNRFKLESNGTLTQQTAAMTQEFYGSTSTAGRIIGGPTSPGSARTLYVSTDSGATWATWGTSPVRFAVAFGTPSAVCVSKHSANRVWVGEAYSGTGRIYKMEGATPVNTLIFTLSTYPGFSSPVTEIHKIVECPSDPTILYVLAFAAGKSYIWRVTDALTTPVFEDITLNAPLRSISWMHVHDLTEDVILGGQFGSRILRCHTGSTSPDAGKLYDRQKAYVDAHIGPGVEF